MSSDSTDKLSPCGRDARSPPERAEGAAAYDAIQGTQADVLVDPRYLIKDYNFLIFRITKGTVQARQGTITGYKQVTAGTWPQ